MTQFEKEVLSVVIDKLIWLPYDNSPASTMKNVIQTLSELKNGEGLKLYKKRWDELQQKLKNEKQGII